MRYIRTKGYHIVDTSVYEKVVERTFNGKVVAIDLGQDSDKKITLILTEDIVRQANSIEELCDCYVVYEKGGGFVGEHHTYNDLELAKYEANEHVSIVYGAIWTDKGLTYVAKLNGKGELELL